MSKSATLPIKDKLLESFSIPEEKRHQKSIGDVLSFLMSDLNMSEGELSRRTGVPQPSIHRILSGKTPHPQQKNLVKLSTFFGISIDQLLARVALPENRISGTINLDTNPSTTHIPLLNWNEIADWLEHNCGTSEMIPINYKLNKKAFALKVDLAHASIEFKVGTTLIFDPQKIPKSGDYVILLQDNKLHFGELIQKKHMNYLYVKDSKLQIAEHHVLVGVLIESRFIFIGTQK